MLTLSPIRNITAGWSSGNLNPLVIIRTHEDVLPTKGIYGRWKSEIGPVEYVEPMLALSPWKSKPVGHYLNPRGFCSD
jgi:hypothetical protein